MKYLWLDCDGFTDEDFFEKGNACDGDDADLCKEGVFVCAADGSLTCDEVTSGNTVEVCDGYGEVPA